MIPKWLSKNLNEKDLENIRERVKHWELNTNAEIVPMIVKSSAPTYLKPILYVNTLIFSMVFAGFFIFILDNLFIFSDVWITTLFVVALTAFFIIYLRKIVNGKVPIFGTKAMLLSLVENRALVEFYSHKFHETNDSTGILLFVSIAERKAVVLADKKISEKHEPETWSQVVKLLIDGAKKRQMGSGFLNAIDACGEILVRDFPAKKENPNELPDHLVIKE